MRRWLFLVAVLFAFPLGSAAQIIPHVAAFGGYTWAHSKFNGINQPGFSLNGWDGSLEVKQFPLVGFVADVSRQYASPSGIRENQTMFLFGPQLSVPGFKKVIPYAHAMAGIIHGTNQVITACPAVSPLPFPCPSFSSTGNAFATALGGGIDYKLSGPIWVRVIQADWLHANLNPDHHTQMRLATGIVFRFGK